MKPAPVRYMRPSSVPGALTALAEAGPGAKVLAGGQSLVPLMSMRLAAPELLVDINRLPDLNYVRVADGQVRVGALARHAAVLASPAAQDAQPLLGQALRCVAHAAIRNRGTVVGSLVHADPAAELPAVLALLGGSVRLAGPGGERTVPASEFFRGPLESAARPGELAVEASFPVLAPGAGTGFAEVSRRRGDYAVCGAAAVTELDGNEQVREARVALLSVGPVPLVIDLTEVLAGAPARPAGRDPGPGGLEAAAALVSERVEPEDDLHATAAYRRQLAGVLTARALAGALAMAAARRPGRPGGAGPEGPGSGAGR